MTTTWNVLKFPMLTLLVVVEFFVIASFSTAPIEHSLLMWLVTGIAFAMWDENLKEMEGE
ncbi:hypothetical protein J5E42_04165 [Mammaliicoccus vitulinus]|uniref:hypothetical protein n=1 Tax=Mammaliicoccus vitulinus TaxID=71237 RepID=UPI001AAE08C0|nr:hypothetical protein [Mammaliicoccus vitulinus]MBO3076706.1 hypothetical protein [Mammaliicoccus vitulinus]